MLLELVRMARVPYEAHYQVTSVDPPEVVRFIKSFPDVIMDIPRDKNGKPVTMWNLIPNKLMPPTRGVRYCCSVLKESAGKNRINLTGVRWDESSRRRDTWGVLNFHGKRSKNKADELEIPAKARKGNGFSVEGLDLEKRIIMLNNDNDSMRQFVEYCVQKGKTILNPIVDWTDADVWEFIREYSVPYCELYDQGFKRIGCIGCPMSRRQKSDLERWPKYKTAYTQAFGKMLKIRKERGLEATWNTADEVMDWWVRW